MPTTVRHRVLSACAEDAIDDVRKTIVAAANTLPHALNRSTFFISSPPCVVRECFSRNRTLGAQSFESRRVQIIPRRGICFRPAAYSQRKLSSARNKNKNVARDSRAAHPRTGKLLLGTYGDEHRWGAKDAAWQNKSRRWIKRHRLRRDAPLRTKPLYSLCLWSGHVCP